jgi:Mg-chelatase subunit ChlD
MNLTVLKRILVLLFGPVALLGGLYLWVVLRSPRPDSGKLVRTADRKIVWSGSSVQIQLHVNADQELPVRPSNTARKSQVIALVLDHSGSMGQGDESPLEAMKSAAAFFARTTAASDQPLGVISFDDSPSEVMPLGPDGEATANAIQQIPSGGGTDLAGGLLAGRELVIRGLESGNYRGATGLIVLLSDGQSDRNHALQAAEQTKTDPKHPIRIITIGLGSQIDQDLLRQMASSEADFHFTLDPAGLGDIYFTIAEDLGTVIAYNGQLAEQFNYGGFKLAKPPVGFPVRIDKSRGQMDFRFPVLFQQRMRIPYTLKAERVGLYGLALKSAILTYVPDPNSPQQVREIVSPLTPPLLVISPLLLLLLYLPLFGYLLWRLLHRMPKPLPAVEPPPPDRISVPPPLVIPGHEPLRPRTPQPTLFLGAGEAGGVVLDHVAKLLANDRYLAHDAEPPFLLLQADTREDELKTDDNRFPIHKAQLPNSLGPVVSGLQDSPSIPAHLNWLPRGELAQIGGSQKDLSQGAHGRRWLTRLALFEACKSDGTPFLVAWADTINWLRQYPKARIVIIGSLQGGTGSALATDLAYLLRSALPESTRAEFPVYALGLADIPSDHFNAGLNQQAFLAELDRFIVAAELTQPAVFNPQPPEGLGYLNGVIDEPIYDHFFLLQSPSNIKPDKLDGEFFSQVAAVCHTFTEQSSAITIEAHLGDSRTHEEDYRHRYLEGTVNSVWQYLLRFPVPEITRRLACRFVCEIVGTNLVGVTLAADKRNLEVSSLPKNPLEEAVNSWTRLPDYIRARVLIYQAFCQAAVSNDPRTVMPALQQGAQGSIPTTDDFRKEFKGFATAWFSLLLNGAPLDSDDEREQWCRHKIQLVRAALMQLVELGRSALEVQRRISESSSQGLVPVLEEIQRFHESWLAQVSSWLQTLIGSELVGQSTDQPVKGVFRSASDELQEIEHKLTQENLLTWQSILDTNDIQNPSLKEESLYENYIGSFLAREHGFVLRWIWQFTDIPGADVPDLRLQVVTDLIRDYEPGEDTAEALRANLFRVADSLTHHLDQKTIIDALRSENGELRLDPLAKRFAGLLTDDHGLQINRQFPGGNQVRRRLLMMIPEIHDTELQRFQNELRRQLSSDVTPVPYRDPHSIRAVVVTSVIPIKAARLQSTNSDGLPFIFEPEQAAERLGGEIYEYLGMAPCPKFHPLTRLLIAAPRRRAEWTGILAEDCIRPARIDGIKPTLVISDGINERRLLREHQEQSWVWAILNLAYRVEGGGPAEAVRLRWESRDQRTKIEMLNNAARRLQHQADSLAETDPERVILEQFVLLIKLEHALEQRRYEEANK